MKAIDAKTIQRDFRRPAEHEVGHDPAGAAGHSPAQRAVAGVEKQIAEGGPADHRHAIRRRRS